jgi:hypothetical protein
MRGQLTHPRYAYLAALRAVRMRSRTSPVHSQIVPCYEHREVSKTNRSWNSVGKTRNFLWTSHSFRQVTDEHSSPLLKNAPSPGKPAFAHDFSRSCESYFLTGDQCLNYALRHWGYLVPQFYPVLSNTPCDRVASAPSRCGDLG